MQNPSFSQNLFDTYQSLSTFMQLAWLVVPFASVCVLFALFLHHMRRMEKPVEPVAPNESHIYRLMYEDIQERIIDGRINEPENKSNYSHRF